MVDVFSFLDARLFLQEVYSFRKNQEPKFSYEVWAKQLGVASKSYLRFAVIGKRKISPVLTQKICENLYLDEKACEYFTLLVMYTQCSVAQQKKMLGEKLTRLLKRKMMFAPVDMSDDVLAQPLLIILRNYLTYADADRRPATLSALFGISEKEVQMALQALADEGMIHEVEGQWLPKHEWIRVGDKPGSAALSQYHRASLLKAIEAQALPPSTRTYRSLSFALSREEYERLLVELGEFAERICTTFDANQIADRCLYQLNFNLVPWTATAPAKQLEADARA